jgi:hypothetical protein
MFNESSMSHTWDLLTLPFSKAVKCSNPLFLGDLRWASFIGHQNSLHEDSVRSLLAQCPASCLWLRRLCWIYGHTTLNTPNLIWSPARLVLGWEKAMVRPHHSIDSTGNNICFLLLTGSCSREAEPQNVCPSSFIFPWKIAIIILGIR